MIDTSTTIHSRKELKAKSAKKNYVYNVLYQVLLLIVPLITTPYISRVLGPEGVGQYSYAYSLITYFTLFAALGFGYYAQREIAANREDAYIRSKLFWEITLCRLLPTALCLGVNFILCFTRVYGDESALMLVDGGFRQDSSPQRYRQDIDGSDDIRFCGFCRRRLALCAHKSRNDDSR